MKLFTRFTLLLALLVPCAAYAQYVPGAQPIVFPTFQSPVYTFTATSQTGNSATTTALASGIIEVKGTALTTATWAMQGSIDGGTTWQALPTAPYPTTAFVTTTAVTQTTTTTNTFYVVKLLGFTKFRFVTSGTFTATNITIQFTGTGVNDGYL